MLGQLHQGVIMVMLSSEIIAAARASQAKWDVPASVTLAQYGVESAWGTRMPAGSNNPFGIKAKVGEPAVEAPTHEVISGKDEKLPQPFRKYASIAEAFDDHGALFNRVALYTPALDQWKAGNLEAGVRLMSYHYATAPNYASVILTIIQQNQLVQYDRAELPLSPVVAPPPLAPNPVTPGVGDPSQPPDTIWQLIIRALVALFARKK